MAFKPTEITKTHVLDAVDKIENENITLTPSTKYLVEIDGKQYPPKDILRHAHQQMNGEFLWKYTGGKPTNKFLEAMGFPIKRISDNPLEDLIRKYKKHLRENGIGEEIYKWHLLEEFKGRPDVNAPDFKEEIKSINFANLIYPVGISVIHHLASDRTARYRDCFKVLFDEGKSLNERVLFFNEETLKIYRELSPEERFSHHQDERTIATFLTYFNPDKYAFYKDSFYQNYCRLLGISSKKKNEKYAHYIELVNDFIEDYIRGDEELLNLVNKSRPSNSFADTNFKLLAQDILYRTLDQQIGMDRAYWRIGTSDENSNSYWEYMKDNQNICIGWKETGDLNNYELNAKKDVINLFNEKGFYPDSKNLLSRKAGEFFNFYQTINNSDVVLAQSGANVLVLGL